MKAKHSFAHIFRAFAAISALTLLISCGGKAAPTGQTYAPGTYTASAKGYHGDVTVAVKVTKNKIASVRVLKHGETPGISDLAISGIPKAIVDSQSLAVDSVSGASFSSKAVIEATTAALKEAGADIEKLMVPGAAAEKEADVELSADVVVIGAGGAGMAAGVSAHQNGATVVILEKMAKVGGNTISAGGAMNAVDEGSETAIKNKDSVALHFKQTYEGGDKKGDEVLVKTLVENAWASVEWLQSMGMKFLPEPFTVTGGLWPRAHKPVDPVGTGFFKTYNAYIEANKGIEVRLNAKAEKLIVENGKVVGVIATGKTGNKITVKANKGVVIASGGFGQNVAMRQEFNKQWPTLDETIKSTNHPGATGDGIMMGREVNAAIVQMENIQLLPLGDPETGSLSGNIETDVEKRIYVNIEGNRFVDEGARRDTMTLALFNQPQKKLWIVVDAHSYPEGTVKNNFNETIDGLVADGRAFKGETVEELAEKIGVPPANLAATVAEFNKHVASKTPDAFGRTLYSVPLDKGPYYAGARVPTVHHTMGGIKIDAETQVIDVNGNVIPGLYAAGEVTGGIHGSNRLGGNALTDITVFGRIAGANAAQGK